MINEKDNPVEWAMLVYNLSDVKDHIDELLTDMDRPDFCEIGFGVRLGHIYEHLNRAWNTRKLTRETTDEEFEKFSKFPNDLDVGEF